MPRCLLVSALCLVGVLAAPAKGSAQSFGLGPRMSLVRGDLPSATPSTRFFGGTMRMAASRRVVFELALDYRRQLSEDGLSRVTERPFQGSLLLFPIRSTIAPYVLAGYGIYQQTTDLMDVVSKQPSASIIERKTGAHMGLGAEVFVGRHAAVFLDYRFRFVRFGAAEEDAEPINFPGQSLIPGLNKFDLSHKGSMITSGMAFYF